MRVSKICLSLLILIILIAFAPSLLSTKLGNQFISTILSKSHYEQVQIAELSLSWFGPQRAKTIFLKDKETTFTLEDLETDSSLFSLIFRKKIGNTSITKLFFEQHGKKIKTSANKSERDRQYQLIGHFELKEGEIILQPTDGSETKIEKLSCTIDPSQKTIQLHAEFDHPKQRGSIVVNANYGAKPQLMAEINALPSALFSSFENLAPLSSLGEFLSATVELKTEEDKSSLSLTAESDALLLKANATGKDTLVFTPESNLTLTLSPTKLQQIGENFLSSATILEPLILTIHPHTLQLLFPIKKLSDLQLTAGFAFSSLSLLSHEQKYSIDNLHGEIHWGAEKSISFESDKSFPYQLQINGNWNEKNNKLNLQIKNSDLKLILSKFNIPAAIDLGSFLTVDLVLDKNGVLGHAKGDLLDFHFLAKKIDDVYECRGEGDLLFTSSQKNILGEKIHFTLESEIQKGIDHFYLPTVKLFLNNELGNGQILASAGNKEEPMSLQTLEAQGNLSLKQIENGKVLSGSIVFDMSGKDNTLHLTVELPKIEAKIDATGYLHEGKFDRKNATFHLIADAREFPTRLLDSLLKKNSLFSSLLGPTLNMHIIAVQDPSVESGLEISYQIDGTGIQSQGTLRANHQFNVSEDAPLFLTYELTPTRYRQLLQRLGKERLPTLILTKSATLNLKISKLICPREGLKIKEFLCQTGFEGQFSSTPLTFVDPENRETVIFNEINGTISGESFSQSINLALQSYMITPSAKEYPQATFSLTADLIDLFNSDGSINHEGATLKITSHLTPFSTSALLGILPLKQNEREKLFALLGNSISYNLSSNITKHEGPISLTINSTQLKANCPLYLTKENVLLLTAPLDAQITLTSEISEMYIKDINPLFIAGVYSEHPITLHISPEGFVLPLSLDLQKISINKGVLDIGQIIVANGGKVQELMQFLKAKGVSKEGTMSAWFTPIYFQLKEGTVSYQRFDLLLASNVHLAFWGRINLVKDKVQMTLGIAPSTLQRSFNIHGVPNSQMFQIKVLGSTSNVELDWSAATARITILVASSTVGQLGTFIGSLLEKVYSALGEKPTPAPTTYPFPWALQKG